MHALYEGCSTSRRDKRSVCPSWDRTKPNRNQPPNLGTLVCQPHTSSIPNQVDTLRGTLPNLHCSENQPTNPQTCEEPPLLLTTVTHSSVLWMHHVPNQVREKGNRNQMRRGKQGLCTSKCDASNKGPGKKKRHFAIPRHSLHPSGAST